MLRDKESLAIVCLLVFVMAVIGAGFLYVYNDNLSFSDGSYNRDKGVDETYNSFFAIVKNREGKPVDGALVKLNDNGTSIKRKTDKNGYAEFFDIKNKRFLINVVKEGYKDKTEWFLANQSPEILLKKEILEIKTILRLHGSNTIGAKYAPELAERFLRKMGAHTIKKEELGSPQENMISGVKGDERLGIEIKAHGSSTGFKSLGEGLCDIGMASRPIKDKEAIALSGLGDMKSFASEHVAGLDGIAVIVHQSNPADSFSIETLGKIFKGKITRWEDTDSGMKGKIEVYARDKNSGTFDTFRSLVLKKNPLASNAKRFESNSDLSDAVSKNPLAIGFTGLPYIRNSKAVAVSVKGGSKVFPTFFTIATEDYPISRRLYLYTPSVPESQYTLDFINFVLSDTGQEIAKNIGFVDLNVKTFTAKVEKKAEVENENVYEKYLASVKGGKRLTVNFRFRSNSFILDNRGIRDLKRVVDFLKRDENSGRNVVLAGFADSNGEYTYNYDLAMKRAEIVSRELRARGVYLLDSVSGGEEIPIASNETTSGRSKNRRVEVWIK